MKVIKKKKMRRGCHNNWVCLLSMNAGEWDHISCIKGLEGVRNPTCMKLPRGRKVVNGLSQN